MTGLQAVLGWLSFAVAAQTQISFQEISRSVGLDHRHHHDVSMLEMMPLAISGGVAAQDYDLDGWVDLYVVCGEAGPNRLYRNLGDGTFGVIEAGLAITGEAGSGPGFADLDGDGWPDLVINGAAGTRTRVFRNQADGTFEEITAESGILTNRDSFSVAFGDPDRDGDLDILQTHWQHFVLDPCTAPCTAHLWLNDGTGFFTDSDTQAGIFYSERDLTFAPNFADINNDRWPDILLAGDFGQSRVFLNDGDGTFTDVTDRSVITDQNGMGAAVGDYDNDLDLDWFVTSIYFPPTGKDGNRLYRNRGDGSFEDATEAANVRGISGVRRGRSRAQLGMGRVLCRPRQRRPSRHISC